MFKNWRFKECKLWWTEQVYTHIKMSWNILRKWAGASLKAYSRWQLYGTNQDVMFWCSDQLLWFRLKIGDVALPTSLSIFSPKVTFIKNLEWLSQIVNSLSTGKGEAVDFGRGVSSLTFGDCYLQLGRMIDFCDFCNWWNPESQCTAVERGAQRV